MGIKHWRVNIDYESQLFDTDYNPLKYQKFNLALEHIFFYINKDPNSSLSTSVNYSAKYLKSIETLGFLSPKISQDQHGDLAYNWWGALQNLDLERKLNSKICSAQLAIDFRLPGPKQFHIREFSELEKILKENSEEKWLFRDPYKMSGQGSHIFKRDELVKNKILFEKILKFRPMLFNNYCDRILDLGFTFNLDQGLDELFFIINRIDGRLSFGGGEYFLNEEDFYREYPELDLENLMKEMRVHLKKVVQHCQELGAVGFLQVDTFIYKDSENEIQINPLVEINYRRTMGQLLYAFKDFAQKKVILKRVVDKNTTAAIAISPPEFQHQLYVEMI
jgi:hypothetical protein